jgi:hypothetical protein
VRLGVQTRVVSRVVFRNVVREVVVRGGSTEAHMEDLALLIPFADLADTVHEGETGTWGGWCWFVACGVRCAVGLYFLCWLFALVKAFLVLVGAQLMLLFCRPSTALLP